MYPTPVNQDEIRRREALQAGVETRSWVLGQIEKTRQEMQQRDAANRAEKDKAFQRAQQKDQFKRQAAQNAHEERMQKARLDHELRMRQLELGVPRRPAGW